MAAYVGLPESKSNAAAGLINFVRNIGHERRNFGCDHVDLRAEANIISPFWPSTRARLALMRPSQD